MDELCLIHLLYICIITCVVKNRHNCETLIERKQKGKIILCV
jgi:hypothetical protein